MGQRHSWHVVQFSIGRDTLWYRQQAEKGLQMIDSNDPAQIECLPPGAAEPIEVFTALAVKHGLIRPGDKLDGNMIDLMADVVGLCATVGDAYGDGDGDSETGGNAGEHIRAVYWP